MMIEIDCLVLNHYNNERLRFVTVIRRNFVKIFRYSQKRIMDSVFGVLVIPEDSFCDMEHQLAIGDIQIFKSGLLFWRFDQLQIY